MLVILIGALSLGLGIGVVKQFSGTDGAYPSQPSLQAVSAPPAVAPVAAGGAQEKSRKAKSREAKSRKAKSREAKKPEKKSATPPAAVSEPSFARAPTTKKRSPAPIQPAREPVASSPPPSSGGGSNHPSTQVQNNPPPEVQHGIGGGEASHGIAPAGG